MAVFEGPEPIEVRVTSPLSVDASLARLNQAIEAGQYSTPERDANGYLRLGGRVASGQVCVTAKPYVIPGVPAGYGAMTLEFRGDLAGNVEGCELRGSINAPLRPRTVWALVVGFAVLGTFAVATGGGIQIAWVLVMAAILGPTWAWVIRHNQRMALRNAGEFARLLTSVIAAENRPT